MQEASTVPELVWSGACLKKEPSTCVDALGCTERLTRFWGKCGLHRRGQRCSNACLALQCTIGPVRACGNPLAA